MGKLQQSARIGRMTELERDIIYLKSLENERGSLSEESKKKLRKFEEELVLLKGEAHEDEERNESKKQLKRVKKPREIKKESGLKISFRGRM